MVFYALSAALVVILSVEALWQDTLTPNHDLGSWFFIAIASLLCPITLPCILRKKYLDWQQQVRTIYM